MSNAMPNTISNKVAIVILSDPKASTDEALGRVFNALAVSYDYDQAGSDVRVQFQGAGTRWPEMLSNPAHPANSLWESVRHTVAGVSCGCADLFGASTSAQAAGMALVRENPVPGTTGIAGMRALIADGYHVITF